jgi:hypothetical protein
VPHLIDWTAVLAMRLPVEASEIVSRLAKEIPDVREERKAFALILGGLASLLGCSKGTLFLYRRASATLYKVRSLGEAQSWDMDTVMRFYRNEKPELKEDTIMAPVRVGDRVVGVVALARDAGFERGAGKISTEILRIVGKMLGSRRRLALLEAESAIAGAMVKPVAAKDVVYRIFHVLRRFVDYDHGATLLKRVDENTGHVVARQVAWAGGKSDIVGETVPFPWQALPPDAEAFVVSDSAAMIREALLPVREEVSPPKLSIMVGPLVDGGDHVGCIEVSSTRADFFVDKDARILSRFLPYLCRCLTELSKNAGGCHE